MSQMKHERSVCQRDFRSTQYVGKGYKSRFNCSSCGRSTWQHLAFLGQRNVVCDGVKFYKEHKQKFN